MPGQLIGEGAATACPSGISAPWHRGGLCCPVRRLVEITSSRARIVDAQYPLEAAAIVHSGAVLFVYSLVSAPAQ